MALNIFMLHFGRYIVCLQSRGDHFAEFRSLTNVAPFEHSFNYRKQPGGKYNQIELRGKPTYSHDLSLNIFTLLKSKV